jgi:hypothetical protein
VLDRSAIHGRAVLNPRLLRQPQNLYVEQRISGCYAASWPLDTRSLFEMLVEERSYFDEVLLTFRGIWNK